MVYIGIDKTISFHDNHHCWGKDKVNLFPLVSIYNQHNINTTKFIEVKKDGIERITTADPTIDAYLEVQSTIHARNGVLLVPTFHHQTTFCSFDLITERIDRSD